MDIEKIKEKLTSSECYYNRLRKLEADLFSLVYENIESYSNIEDSEQLGEIIGAVTEALGNIQAEYFKLGYEAGIIDTLQALKEPGLTEFNVSLIDFSEFELTEADKKEFEKMEKELEQLDPGEFFNDCKINI